MADVDGLQFSFCFLISIRGQQLLTRCSFPPTDKRMGGLWSKIKNKIYYVDKTSLLLVICGTGGSMGDINFGCKRIKKSRKEHTCYHCQEVIPKGSGYSSDAGIFDGGIYNFKSHHECYERYCDLNKDSDCDNWHAMDEFDGIAEWREKIRGIYENQQGLYI